MMLARFPTLARTLTITLLVFYAALGVLAGLCQEAGMSSVVGHRHVPAHHDGLQAVLCVFACQVNETSGIASSVPDIRPVRLFFETAVALSFFGQLVRQNGIRARAPPSPISAR